MRFPDMPKSPPKSWRAIPDRMDLIGFILFAPAIIMILLALQWGGSTFAWSSGTVIGLFVGGPALLLVFGIYEHRRGQKAMVPISLLKQTVVWSACLVSVFQNGAMMLLSFYLPTWFVLHSSHGISGSEDMFLGPLQWSYSIRDVFPRLYSFLFLCQNCSS